MRQINTLIMKKVLFLCLGLLTSIWTVAQNSEFPVVTIQEIQFVPDETLAACEDSSTFLGDTVTIFGTIVMDGNLSQVSSSNVWVQDSVGPFSGIDVFVTSDVESPVPGTDVQDLIAGDSVRITGIVITFGNESEIAPLEIEVLASGRPVGVTPVDLSDLNDANQVNKPETGEQWEGVYIELTNLTVTSVDFFSGDSRVSFIASDDAGNLINVSDRFLVQRLPGNGGSFVPPIVGTVYDTLRGVIVHSANGCFGENGRGYELFPFQESDYVVKEGFSPPLISGITRNPGVPSGDDDANISATVEDVDGEITSVSLFYAVGINNEDYREIEMEANGSTYSAAIPSTEYSDGDIVKYYISASDNDQLTATQPDVPGSDNPLFFTVRDEGLTIFDVQFTPFGNGNSGYRGQTVTVAGVVTASAESDNLGLIYIQQEGDPTGGWRGLQVSGNAALANAVVGDKLQVTGTIEERFGLTVMTNVTDVEQMGSGEIEPLVLDPGIFSEYDFETNELYEGMLITLANPDESQELFIVEANADGTSNFGEYRVGIDTLDPQNGARILAGRNDGRNAFGSLNFSFINDSLWIADGGILNVDPCVIDYGDTLTSITGIMYYSFGNMKLLPRNNDDMENFRGGCQSPGPITSLEDDLRSSLISMYPNPVSDRLHISYSFPQPVQGQVSLYDMTGRKLMQQSLKGVSGMSDVLVSNLQTGTYIMMLEVENVVVRREKVVVIR